MPRRKAELDTVPITISLSPETYAQIERAAREWGYTVQEWLDEAIRNQL